MAEVTIRLSKAIKEFNLSIDHIVGFLATRGLKIESNPNTKLSGEAYALLQKEFQPDKIAKEEAIKVTQTKLRKDTSVILDVESKLKTSPRKDDETPEILIKGFKEEKEKKKPVVVKEEKVEE